MASRHHRHRDSQENPRPRSRSPYRPSFQPPSAGQVYNKSSRGQGSGAHYTERPHSRSKSPLRAGVNLPFRASRLSKHDLQANEALLALYLDIQKQINLEELDKRELKGRWKSFVNKWNRGELAEGWYDPQTKARADASAAEYQDTERTIPPREKDDEVRSSRFQGNLVSEHEDEEEVGPSLPGRGGGTNRLGPAIPSRGDLEYRDEMRDEDRANAVTDLRHERKQDRRIQKERLEDLAPRAAAGTQERRQEKRADNTIAQATYKESQEGGGQTEVGDRILMGGEDEDGVDAFRRRKMDNEKKKNEREIRKEEILRARALEREERLAVVREKEEKTMEMLRAIAHERFG